MKTLKEINEQLRRGLEQLSREKKPTEKTVPKWFLVLVLVVVTWVMAVVAPNLIAVAARHLFN